MNRARLTIALAVAACWHSSSAVGFAQDHPAPADDGSSRLSFSIAGGASHFFEADVDDSDATVSLSRIEGEATITYQASDAWRWGLTLGAGLHSYDFSGDLGLGADELLDEAISHDVTLTAMHIINDTWSVVAGGTVRAGYESGADVSEGLTYGGFAAVGYRASANLSWQFGAAVRSQLEDNTLVLPYIGVQYQLSETTALRSKGLGLELSMRINDELTASIFGQYELQAFRLADDNPLLPSGVMEDRMIVLGASAMWRPDEQFTLTATVGAAVWRELDFRDDDGSDLDEVELDPSSMLALRASFNF